MPNDNLVTKQDLDAGLARLEASMDGKMARLRAEIDASMDEKLNSLRDELFGFARDMQTELENRLFEIERKIFGAPPA